MSGLWQNISQYQPALNAGTVRRPAHYSLFFVDSNNNTEVIIAYVSNQQGKAYSMGLHIF